MTGESPMAGPGRGDFPSPLSLLAGRRASVSAAEGRLQKPRAIWPHREAWAPDAQQLGRAASPRSPAQRRFVLLPLSFDSSGAWSPRAAAQRRPAAHRRDGPRC